jgi:hypothetical protein
MAADEGVSPDSGADREESDCVSINRGTVATTR